MRDKEGKVKFGWREIKRGKDGENGSLPHLEGNNREEKVVHGTHHFHSHSIFLSCKQNNVL
jgi:hypothetical protein